MHKTVDAQCQCGQVSYTLAQAPDPVLACHCRECQTLSTAPFSVTAVVPAHAVTFRGEMGTFQRIAESGNTNVARFCTGCGNRIYHYNPDSPETIKLKLKPAGSEYSDWFTPSLHVWVKEKQSWYAIPDGMPAYDTVP